MVPPPLPGPVGGTVLSLLGFRLAEQPDLHDRRVGLRGVVHVAGEVLGADLPVRLDPPALRAAYLEPVRTLLGVEVQIEREIAEIVLQRLGIGIHAEEDQPVVAGQPRRRQQGLALLLEAVLAAVGITMKRQAGDAAVVAIRPAMVGAPEIRGVAHLRAAHLHTAVQAHVEHRTDVALGIARDDEGIVEHPPHDVVAVLRDLRLVCDEHPRTAEQPLLFQLEDLPVVVDVGRNHPAANVVEDGHQASLSASQRIIPHNRGCRMPSEAVNTQRSTRRGQPRLREIPWEATRSATTRRGRLPFSSGTTMPSAAITSWR